MMRREGIALAEFDPQVDRGDRHHDPARPAARPADLLTAVGGPCAATALARRLVQAHRRRGGDIERLFAAGLRDAQPARHSAAASVGGDALPFVAEHPGAGPRQRRSSAAALPACELVATSGTAERVERRPSSSPSTRCKPKCAPMPARSTLGDHSAARALERQHLRDAERRRAAQDAADVAGVLQPVEHHARRARLRSPARAPGHATKPIAGRRLEPAQPRQQRGRHDRHAAPPDSARSRSAGSLPAGFARSPPAAPRRRAAAQRRAQVIALEPHLRRACDRPPGPARSLRSRTSSGLSRELIRSGATAAHPPPARRRTGAKQRRCAGQAPCSRSAARCVGRRVALVRRRSRTADAARAVPRTGGRAAPWPGSTRRRSPPPWHRP